jgi:hypothetical protein
MGKVLKIGASKNRGMILKDWENWLAKLGRI